MERREGVVELRKKVLILEQRQAELVSRQEQSTKCLHLCVIIALAILLAIVLVSVETSTTPAEPPVETTANRRFDIHDEFNNEAVSLRKEIAEAENKTAELRAEVDKLRAIDLDTVRINEIVAQQSERMAASEMKFTALEEEVSGLKETFTRELETLERQKQDEAATRSWSVELRQDLVDTLRDKQSIVTSKLEGILLREETERLKKNEVALNRAIDLLLQGCECSSPLIEMLSMRQDVAFLAQAYNGSEQLHVVQGLNVTVMETEVRRLFTEMQEILVHHVTDLIIRQVKFRAEFESELEAMKRQMHENSGADERRQLRYELRTLRQEAARNLTEWVEFRSQVVSTVEENKVEIADMRSQILVHSLKERYWMNRLWWSLAPLVLVLLVMIYPLNKMSKKQDADKQHLVVEIETQRRRIDGLTSKQADDKWNIEVRLETLATTQREHFEQQNAVQRGNVEQHQASQQQIEEQRERIGRLANKQEDDKQNVEVRVDELARAQTEQQAYQQQIDELRRRITDARETDREVRDGSGLPDSKTVPLEPTIPFHITMTDFLKHRMDSDTWYSKPFYTHTRGYKMCLAVHANGVGSAEGKYVSVFVHLMRGEFDDELVWPFRGKIKVYLLNRFKDSEHRELAVGFKQNGDRVVTGERASSGLGNECLVSYHNLSYDNEQQTQYLKHNSLRFQVAEVELNDDDNSAAVVPVEVVMTDFEGRKRSKGWFGSSENWFSEPFYSHPGGYKMCLGIATNGCGDGKSTHVSMHIYLMRGEHDENLTWPFCGTITIQLLKQDSNGEQWEKKVEIYARSVMFWHERATCGRGYTKFIPHTELYREDVEYIQSDSLKFRVAEVVVKST